MQSRLHACTIAQHPVWALHKLLYSCRPFNMSLSKEHTNRHCGALGYSNTKDRKPVGHIQGN